MEMYRNGELIMLQDKKNLVCVPSPDPVRLYPVLRPALEMALVRVPINAALMAVDMFARNHWVCTLTNYSCLITLNLSLLALWALLL